MEELHQNNTRRPDRAHVVMETTHGAGSVFYFSYLSFRGRAAEDGWEAKEGGEEVWRGGGGEAVSDKRNRDRGKQVRRGQQTGNRGNELTDKGSV